MGFQRKRNHLARPLTDDEALVKLERFCAFRERCEKEVWEKIAELGLLPSLGEKLFRLLKEERFFDNERFAQIFVRGKFLGNHWGRVRLRMELKMRQIPADIMEEALATIQEEKYLETIGQLLRKKLDYWAEDPQKRMKSAASVIRSGFEPDLVFQTLNQLGSVSENHEE